MRAVSELKDGIIHYDASVSSKRIFETQHQGQDTAKHKSIEGNLQQYCTSQIPLNSFLIAELKRFCPEILFSAPEISLVRQKTNIPVVILGQFT